MGHVVPEPGDGERIVCDTSGPGDFSNIVVGGVGFDINEPSPDEPPGDVNTINNSDPEAGVGPVPPVVNGGFIGTGGFSGLSTVSDELVSIGISNDSLGIFECAVSDGCTFIGGIGSGVDRAVSSVTEAILCHSRHSEEREESSLLDHTFNCIYYWFKRTLNS